MKFRVLQKLSVMLIVLSILTSLYSCGSEDVPANRDKGISSVDGDESTGGTLPSPTMIDYKTDKSVFNINEVKVTYYYGFLFGKNPDFEYMISQGWVYTGRTGQNGRQTVHCPRHEPCRSRRAPCGQSQHRFH